MNEATAIFAAEEQIVPLLLGMATKTSCKGTLFSFIH
jgi:hypothetical protein